MKEELVVGWKHSAAALNRFIYYPDHLVRMPGPGQRISDMLWTAMTEPAFTGLFLGLFEARRAPRPASVEDESVSSFLARRTGGPHIGNNLVSAVLHGIYAGDIDKLSAKSIMALPYYYEKEHGSVGNAYLKARKDMYYYIKTEDLELRREMGPKVKELSTELATASVFSFKKGIGAFTDALEKSLRANPNVQFRTKDRIMSVEHDVESNGIQVLLPFRNCPAVC